MPSLKVVFGGCESNYILPSGHLTHVHEQKIVTRVCQSYVEELLESESSHKLDICGMESPSLGGGPMPVLLSAEIASPHLSKTCRFVCFLGSGGRQQTYADTGRTVITHLWYALLHKAHPFDLLISKKKKETRSVRHTCLIPIRCPTASASGEDSTVNPIFGPVQGSCSDQLPRQRPLFRCENLIARCPEFTVGVQVHHTREIGCT